MKQLKFKCAPEVHVIYFDTEQSKHDVQGLGRRILKILGGRNQPRLSPYYLQGLSPPEKRLLILNIVSDYKGVRLVIIIDNVRDLMYNINDQTEALTTILMIQQLCAMGHHVMIALHSTRGGDLLGRGAIGSEAHNRCEVALEVIKQGEISIVKPILTRGKPFEEFAIGLNAENEPVIVQDWIKAPEKQKGRGKRSTNPADISEEDHRKVLEKFMLNADGRGVWVTRKEMVANLKTGFLNLGISIGDNKLRDYLKYYEEQKIIGKTQKPVGKTKVDNYQLLRKKACSSVC